MPHGAVLQYISSLRDNHTAILHQRVSAIRELGVEKDLARRLPSPKGLIVESTKPKKKTRMCDCQTAPRELQ